MAVSGLQTLLQSSGSSGSSSGSIPQRWRLPAVGVGLLLLLAFLWHGTVVVGPMSAVGEQAAARSDRVGSQLGGSIPAGSGGGAPEAAAPTALQPAEQQQGQTQERQQEQPQQQQQDASSSTQPAAPATGTAQLSQWRVLVGIIGRQVAHELPHILHNVKMLAAAAKFRRVDVMLVENDSSDDTTGNFTRWAEANPDLHGELRSLPPQQSRFPKDLTVLAEARNVYLDALRLEQRYADVDWLLVVDTDMCQLWDFAEVARVTAEVAPHVQVLYANGGCGWYEDLHEKGDLGKAMPMRHPQAAPIYCDLFALRAAKTRQTFSMHGSKVWWTPGTCRGSPAATKGLPCTQLAGHAVVPVDTAFGGWGLYRADVLRGAGRSCRYASKIGECEHVPLGLCLTEQANATQVIATGLLVDWEGCERPFPPV